MRKGGAQGNYFGDSLVLIGQGIYNELPVRYPVSLGGIHP